MQVTANGIEIRYELEGNASGTPVLLSHALGASLHMWDSQLEALGARWRVLRYDTRGHGSTSVPPGPYTLEQLADDAAALLDSLRIEKAHFVGLSMGGMIAQTFALRYPHRLERLVLCDTTSEIPDVMQPMWEERIRTTQARGMEPHVEPTLERWLTEGFRKQRADVAEWIGSMIAGTAPTGYVGCCEAIRRLALTERLGNIGAPTLVVVGAEDPGTTPEVARGIHERISGSELAVIDDAAHLCNVEQAERFNDVVVDFLARGGSG